jgi:Ca2+-binding RTX toxin-like protein
MVSRNRFRPAAAAPDNLLNAHDRPDGRHICPLWISLAHPIPSYDPSVRACLIRSFVDGGSFMASYPVWLPRVGAAIAVTLAFAGWGSPAQAATNGTATVQSATEVSWLAGTGRVNAITVTRSGKTITIDDTVTITPGTGCKRVGTDVTKVSCTTTSTPTTVTISAGDLNDTIVNKSDLTMNGYGGAGNDTVTGGPVADTLDGGAGNDKVNGLGGLDTLLGRVGNDTLNGGAGDDLLTGGAGTDILYGGAGGDTVSYADHSAAVVADLDGATGDDGQSGEKDTIKSDVESIIGGTGADRLTGNRYGNVLDGGKGNDVVYGGWGDDTIRGDDGNDTLYGENGADDIQGGLGNDTVKAGGESDIVSGDAGIDTVYGDTGDDVIQGDDGNDVLRGGVGNDFLFGGVGNDRINGDADNDQLWGNGSPRGTPNTELDVLDGGAATDGCHKGTRGSLTNCE